jgi:uncharacterized protein
LSPVEVARSLSPAVHAALSDTPVVLIVGARQTGKSTLARHLVSERGYDYVTLDALQALGAARNDPRAFLAGLGERVVIDEVQRAPDLFLPIKEIVDRERRPGRFVLTGSANVLLLPRLADTLVGRMEVLTLWPFSQGEIESRAEQFVDEAFSNTSTLTTAQPISREEAVNRILRGGYPEAVHRSEIRRDAWFASYVETMLQRQITDLAQIENVEALRGLLSMVAARNTSIVNYAALSRDSGLPQTTLKRYLALFQLTYLTLEIPAWFTNISKRAQKSPKLLMTDTGLASWLLDLSAERLKDAPSLLGNLLESFVSTELVKQIGWSRTQPRMHHFRAFTGQEVDIVLEDRRGRIVGIEVKAASSIGRRDLGGLRYLAENSGDRFHRGIILYLGDLALGLGERIHALPVNALWGSKDLLT